MSTRDELMLPRDVVAPGNLPPTESGYTISQVSAIVGMSPRNVRAHQARGLLWSPTRRGRTAVYSEHHIERLRLISRLQSDGFNLTAIQRLLHQRERSADNSVERILSAVDPMLVAQLETCGVVSRSPDGTYKVAAPHAVRAALELRRHGLSGEEALEVLDRLIAQLCIVAREVIELLADDIESRPGFRCPGDELPAALVKLVIEATRVAIQSGERPESRPAPLRVVEPTGADAPSSFRTPWPRSP